MFTFQLMRSYLSRWIYIEAPHSAVKGEQLGFMTAPPLWMLCSQTRQQQLIEMEELGLVLSCFYLFGLPAGNEGGLQPSTLVWSSSVSHPFGCHPPSNAADSCSELVGALVSKPEGRNLSRSRLTTSSNMVWLVVNECSGSRPAVVWNRWWSRCSWSLASSEHVGGCLTQTRLPAFRNRNRWRWKMRHLSEVLKPPPMTLPTRPPPPPHLLNTHSDFPSSSFILSLMTVLNKKFYNTCLCHWWVFKLNSFNNKKAVGTEKYLKSVYYIYKDFCVLAYLLVQVLFT